MGWICCRPGPNRVPRHPACCSPSLSRKDGSRTNFSTTLFCSHLKLCPASTHVQNQKIDRKKRKVAVEASTSSKTSTWKGVTHAGQTLSFTIGRGKKSWNNIYSHLLTLILASPFFLIKIFREASSWAWRGSCSCTAPQGCTAPRASGHMLHFSGKAPKKILTPTIFLTDCLWHRTQNVLQTHSWPNKADAHPKEGWDTAADAACLWHHNTQNGWAQGSAVPDGGHQQETARWHEGMSPPGCHLG